MLRFGPVSLDVDAREVRLAGEIQHLEPQAFDLLTYLVAHRDRVVPKEELLDEVWGDQFVSESALTTRIKEIRKVTGDDGRTQRVVKNVRGRGYRFVASPTPQPTTPAQTATTVLAPASGERRDRGQRRIPPQPPTPSIGLEAEIDRLAELTSERRLITIVGPGGVGKTRLATEVGRAVAERHVLGTRIVELARISDPEAVGPAIRRALGRSEVDLGANDGLGAVDALLVIDNCEHVIDAVAAEVPALLAGGEELHVVTTSREPLGVPGELRWSLAPLSTVGANAPAIKLFVERARDVAVLLEPTDHRVHATVSHLDGMPLALEMAAARLATIGLADLLSEVERNVGSLRSGPRGVPERHSTLRAMLAWSEALLTPNLRSSLADFSVFAGPVESSDLPAVMDDPDPVGAVSALAERSLVTVDTTPDARARYGSLETVRQFGRERLGEDGRLETVRRRHARWFTEAGEEAAESYDSVDQSDAIVRIDAIFDELRSAHRWARQHEPSLAMRISFALFQPAFQQLRLEVFDWSLALAEVVDSNDDQVARLYGEIALGLTLVGRIEDGRRWAERAIASASDPSVVRGAYGTMADIHLYTGDLEESLAFARLQDELTRDHGSRIERAVAKASLALPLAYLGRRDEALEVIPAEPLAGSPPVAWGWLAYARGEVLLDSDPKAALEELDAAIELTESVDGHFLSGVAHVAAASLRTRTGQAHDAIGPLAATIERLADQGNTTHLLTTLRNLPSLLIRLEEWSSAAQVLGGLSASTISPTFGEEADRLDEAERAARSALGDEAYDSDRRIGAGRSLSQTAAFAVATLRALDAQPGS